MRPLSVDILLNNQPLSADRTYDIECQAIGSKPSAKITWWMNGVQLRNFREKVCQSKCRHYFDACACVYMPKSISLIKWLFAWKFARQVALKSWCTNTKWCISFDLKFICGQSIWKWTAALCSYSVHCESCVIKVAGFATLKAINRA